MTSDVSFETADAVERSFYAAMRAGDVAAMMALWAETGDLVCVHPGCMRLTTRRAIEESWTQIFSEHGQQVTPVFVRAIKYPNLEIHSVIEEFRGDSTGGQRVALVATNVYAKGPDGWRMVVHHCGTASGDESTIALEHTRH